MGRAAKGRRGWAGVLGLAILLLAAALPSPAAASAPASAGLETRVWASGLDIAAGVRVEQGLSPTSITACGARCDEVAVGSRLVPRGAASLDPRQVRFSQNSVGGVEEIAQSMRAHGWQGPPIDVVRLPDGTLVSVDNTRLLAAHRAGIEVRAVVHEAGDALPAEFAQRCPPRQGPGPTSWGEAVLNRIGS